MKLAIGEMDAFYQQYKADAQDGFVSNIKQYVESKLKGLPEEDIEEIVKELEQKLIDDNYVKYACLCSSCGKEFKSSVKNADVCPSCYI